MLYIKEDTTATPVEPVILKPVTNQAGKKVDNTVTSEASSETAKSENTTVNKGSEAPTDTKPSVEAPKLDEITKPAPTVDELVNSTASSEVSESTTVSSKVSETDIISEASTSETSISTVVSESEVVKEPAVSLTESESQVSTSEVTSAISETVSTSEEVILDGLSENINSWNRLSAAPRVSENLPSTSETITEAASLFSNYARYSETASSESYSMVATSSEASIEKLAVSILKDTEGGLYDATTIRNIVEMIDSITTNVSYTRSSRQDLINTASSDNTYSGSQDLNLASKTTTQAGEKGTTEDLKATIAKTAKSHKWGEHAVAILTAIVLAGAATLAALRNFLMSKKVDK